MKSGFGNSGKQVCLTNAEIRFKEFWAKSICWTNEDFSCKAFRNNRCVEPMMISEFAKSRNINLINKGRIRSARILEEKTMCLTNGEFGCCHFCKSLFGQQMMRSALLSYGKVDLFNKWCNRSSGKLERSICSSMDWFGQVDLLTWWWVQTLGAFECKIRCFSTPKLQDCGTLYLLNK